MLRLILEPAETASWTTIHIPTPPKWGLEVVTRADGDVCQELDMQLLTDPPRMFF